ncbi:hypothetical protein, partial [Bifidobacterium kimbladii]|uniref:hypothetical protein n=1 Tax=Bifidobacterium kimbladii TaxID=1293826 RepID=UPI001E53D75F
RPSADAAALMPYDRLRLQLPYPYLDPFQQTQKINVVGRLSTEMFACRQALLSRTAKYCLRVLIAI